MQTADLTQSLIEQTNFILQQLQPLQQLPLQTLRQQPAPGSWNILQCLEHLNLYGQFYLPAIEQAISNSRTNSESEFTPGFLGNYFAASMLPKEKLNKMKTFKSKNPIHAVLDKTVLDIFLSQQQHLLQLLNRSKKVSLNKVRVATSISPLLRLKLGDTFRFFINHQLRHLKQIERIQQQTPPATAQLLQAV